MLLADAPRRAPRADGPVGAGAYGSTGRAEDGGGLQTLECKSGGGLENPERRGEDGSPAGMADGGAGRAGGGSPGCWPLPPQAQVLATLLLIFTANQTCRALPSYLVDFGPTASPLSAMNVGLQFSPRQYGFFATLAFTLPFTFASFFTGMLADSSDRWRILGVSGLAWSACTVGMARAASYDALLALRVLLGLAQAATNPAALSLIADTFPDARATASSIFNLGIYIGGGCASLGAVVGAGSGWRRCCLMFGTASAIASALAFRRRELHPHAKADAPGLEDCEGIGAPAGNAAVPGVLGRFVEVVTPTPMRWLFLAASFRFCAGFSILVWLPTAVRELFPGDVERFAVYNSLIKSLVGGFSSFAGGLIADRLRAQSLGDRAGVAFCAVSSLVAAPLWYLIFATGRRFDLCMFFLLVQYLVAESWLGPTVATLQSAVPQNRRGVAQGVFSALTALGNVLPAALGFLASDDLASGLQVSVALCYLLSAVCFLGAFASLPRRAGGG